jgi:hypothetical protein
MVISTRPPFVRLAAWGLALALAPTLPIVALDARDLQPGTGRAALEATLADANLRTARWGRRALLTTGPLLASVYASQRALLELDAEDRLRLAWIVVEPDPESDGAELLRLYEQVKTDLLRTLGPATWEHSSGQAPSREILGALASGRVERTIQWDGPLAVRAGIPPRADGRLVVQNVLSAEPLERGQRLWGREGF